MVLAYPLAIDWFAGLPVARCSFYLPGARQISRTRGGEIIDTPLAARLWRGRMTLWQVRHAPAAAVEARLNLLEQGGATFFAHPMPLYAPIADPAGAALGAATPTVSAFASNGREVRIAGLPAYYVLSTGDFMAWPYGSNPTRYALHQIVVGGTANGAGLSPFMEITPPARGTGTTGQAVTLVRPAAKCVMLPRQPGEARRVFTDGITLEFIQTLA
jgi:hypothetical protein